MWFQSVWQAFLLWCAWLRLLGPWTPFGEAGSDDSHPVDSRWAGNSKGCHVDQRSEFFVYILSKWKSPRKRLTLSLPLRQKEETTEEEQQLLKGLAKCFHSLSLKAQFSNWQPTGRFQLNPSGWISLAGFKVNNFWLFWGDHMITRFIIFLAWS